jgi:hypothetical protein
MNTPVVMISGFTHPTNEFDTPYRVISYVWGKNTTSAACMTDCKSLNLDEI